MLTKYKSLNQFKKLLLDKNEARTTSIKKKYYLNLNIEILSW